MIYRLYIRDPSVGEYREFEYDSYFICNTYFEELLNAGYTGFMLCSVEELQDALHWSLLSNNLPRC